MAKKNDTRLPVHYLNPSAYVPGVPQCDMTAEQWAELPAALRTLALDSGLYEVDADVPAPVQADAPASNEECEGCQQ